MYRCPKCGETMNELPKGIIRCPVCAHKILMKMRDPITKTIQAR